MQQLGGSCHCNNVGNPVYMFLFCSGLQYHSNGPGWFQGSHGEGLFAKFHDLSV